jgi:hypothetical protein
VCLWGDKSPFGTPIIQLDASLKQCSLSHPWFGAGIHKCFFCDFFFEFPGFDFAEKALVDGFYQKEEGDSI